MEKKGRCQERNHPYSVSWHNDDELFLEGKTGKGEGWERGEGKIEFIHMYLHLIFKDPSVTTMGLQKYK